MGFDRFDPQPLLAAFELSALPPVGVFSQKSKREMVLNGQKELEKRSNFRKGNRSLLLFGGELLLPLFYANLIPSKIKTKLLFQRPLGLGGSLALPLWPRPTTSASPRFAALRPNAKRCGPRCFTVACRQVKMR